MSEKSLDQLIADARNTGSPDEQIMQALLNAGWSQADVMAAINKPKSWLIKPLKFRAWSTSRKVVLGILMLLFFGLVVLNIYLWRSGHLPFGETEYEFSTFYLLRAI